MPKKQAGEAPIDGLKVLVKIGIFSPVGNPHWKARHKAQEFRLSPKYKERKQWTVPLELTAKEEAKWNERNLRATARFEVANPIIGIVRGIASTQLRFSAEGLNEICRIKTSEPDHFDSANRCREALYDGKWESTLDRQGTLHSPVSGCPKRIRQLLEIDRNPVAEVDISGAHIVVLSRVYDTDFQRRYNLRFDHSEIDAERAGLNSLIKSGDVYGIVPGERSRNKRELLTALNSDPKIQRAMNIIRALLSDRPILQRIIEAVKERDHRTLSWWLQRWVSEITNPAVLSLHSVGIPSIPIVDCLLVRRCDIAKARNELSRRIYESTGICAMVGGIRWDPEKALQFRDSEKTARLD